MPGQYGGVVVPVRLRKGDQVLSFFSTIATFGTAVDLTVAELSLETFFPADAQTTAYLTGVGHGPAPAPAIDVDPD